jgi:hypothetical protein
MADEETGSTLAIVERTSTVGIVTDTVETGTGAGAAVGIETRTAVCAGVSPPAHPTNSHAEVSAAAATNSLLNNLGIRLLSFLA